MKINFFPVNDSKYPAHLQKIEYQSPLDCHSDWCYYLPPEHSASDTCVVVLHGFGGHGSQLFLRPSLRRCCLPEYLKRNYHILTPELRGDAWMNPSAMADLEHLLQFLRSQLGIRNILLDSGSMGGFSNLLFAARHPDQIQGLIVRGTAADLTEYCRHCENHIAEHALFPEILSSICRSYGGRPSEQPDLYRLHSPKTYYRNLQAMPFYLSHGDSDELMPVAASRELARLCAAFPRFCYHEIPGGVHESPLKLTSAPLDWIEQFLSGSR